MVVVDLVALRHGVAAGWIRPHVGSNVRRRCGSGDYVVFGSELQMVIARYVLATES